MSKKRSKANNAKRFTKRTINSLSSNKSQTIHIYKEMIVKLGLQDFFQKFSEYFKRQVSQKQNTFSISSKEYINVNIDDDLLSHILHIPSIHKLQYLIQSLDSSIADSLKLPKVCVLNKELIILSKNGYLGLYDIFQFIKMVKFFFDFCNNHKDIEDIYLLEYLSKFTFPQEILDLIAIFDFTIQERSIMQSYLKENADLELTAYYKALLHKHKEKQEILYTTLNANNLQDYLVDRQIHLFENNQTLLVRPGYSNVLHARVVGRSANGFFYIVPSSLDSLEMQIHSIEDKIEERLVVLSKQYSKILNKHIHFLRFINTEYDFIDMALARVNFAKELNLHFIFLDNQNNDSIILNKYSHPSLKNAVPFSIDFSKNLLMITGVNAGGKTMLLKSILSALFCVKLLIPMKIDNTKSKLPFIKNIHIIAQDPQDSHNDISTFSGRIKEISHFLEQKDLIIGIDEIEIGTDSSEAASLYKVILNKLLSNQVKIIVTTHHKHLASLMADNPNTQLIAALYNYKLAKPTFEFVNGIGKSYAMECASHYGIPKDLINEAKKVHGDEANKLDRLIEESNYQITKNKQDSIKLQELIQKQELKNKELDKAKINLKLEFEKQSLELKRHYNEAIKEIKMLAKQSQRNLETIENTKNLQTTQTTIKSIHKLLNKAYKNELATPQINIESNLHLNIGEWVKHKNKFAQIIEINNDTYTIEFNNGLKLKSIKAIELTPVKKPKENTKTYNLQANIKANTTLDLHGYTKEEAIETLELFLNQAIMAKFSEVLIVHGMGSGILRNAIENFLNNCNYIRGYIQAPPNMGGIGAKIIYLN